MPGRRSTDLDRLLGEALDTAYGSACEVEYQLSLAKRLGLLADEAASRLSPLSPTLRA